MKKKYWVTGGGLILFGVALYVTLLFYHFAGLLFCAIGAVILLFGAADALKGRFPKTAKTVRIVLRIGVCVVLLAAIGTGIWVGICCKGDDDPKADFVIVLGAGVNGDVPSKSLSERLQATQAYLERYPDAIAILSGGKGDGENLSEALCMYRWLTERGVAPERLRMEDRATTTEENLRYSLELIEAEFGARPETAAVVSSSYHLARASLLAEAEGLRMLGVPASTDNPIYFCQMFLREICGVWYTVIF
ncbi:MAG: YdcF family protein [Oscillospiraceae bacterium]|nr:YdcF family protein [Oscillospiraceae bacterium]